MLQEILEDIINENDNFLIIETNDTACSILDKELGDVICLTPIDDEKVSISTIRNGFIDCIYKPKEVSTNDLKAFFEEETVEPSLSISDIKELTTNKGLSLIGIFIQPIMRLEKEYDDFSKNYYTTLCFLIEDIKSKEKFFINFSESGGILDGWPASYGEFFISPIDGEIDMNNAIYTPRNRMYIDVERDVDSVNLFVRDNIKKDIDYDEFLAGVEVFGGDSIHPSGGVTFNLPDKKMSKYFSFNEEKDTEISLLEPACDIEEIYEKTINYSWELAND